jgi:hypothetical protein
MIRTASESLPLFPREFLTAGVLTTNFEKDLMALRILALVPLFSPSPLMSHLHHVTSPSDNADHYRIYLERSQAARLAAGNEKTRKKTKTEASELALDPDQDSSGNPDRNPKDEEGKNSEGEPKEPGGFGKHYA